MDLTYNSISGINTDPTVYLKEFITKNGKPDNQMTADTRIFMLIALVVIIIIYGILFAVLGGGSTSGTGEAGSTSGPAKSIGLRFFEVLLWSVFILLILLNGFQYFFNVNLTTRFVNFFSDEPKLEITMQVPEDEPVQEMKIKKEVFNIPDNKYSYDDAKAICAAYGAKLANYDEVESSYKSGGEWCNYGWSDNQMALFPTQKETWDKLQKIKGHEHDCGRPGINGGFIDNKDIQFGVNCYGYKPLITPAETQKMQTASVFPITMKDVEKQNRIDYWKKRIPEILLSPFNRSSWSVI
jgi:Extracellular link domain.